MALCASYLIRLVTRMGLLTLIPCAVFSQLPGDILSLSENSPVKNTYPCRISYEGNDPVTKDYRRDLMPDQLFSHTDEKLRSFLPGKDFIVCHGSLTAISGGFRSLILYLTLASPNSRKTYGALARGSPLTLRLIDGKEITLLNERYDPGVLDDKSGETTYTGIFRINSQAENMLLKSEVDEMRVVWTTGFETYEVHNVDFFINQFNCLNNNP